MTHPAPIRQTADADSRLGICQAPGNCAEHGHFTIRGVVLCGRHWSLLQGELELQAMRQGIAAHMARRNVGAA